MKISHEIQELLICPRSKSPLKLREDELECSADPAIRYPVINGIPILIDDTKSIFSIADFAQHHNTTFDLQESPLRKTIKRLMPKITHNLKAKENFRLLLDLLAPGSKVLVIGGSIRGLGSEALYAQDDFEIVGADVSYGPLTNIVCDAHDLPFRDQSFDCIIIQVVLEHVLDPPRCVAEVHRVLKPSGLVYAETPFMQQVHMRQHDFTRYTHLGHRRLFRDFEEIKSGPSAGPGMSLAWSYTWFLRSFATSPVMVYFLIFFGYITSFFLKYFDYYLLDKPGSYDAASFFYFMGRKSQRPITDQELLAGFRGLKHKF
jgi:SAM-dependent methyltransferase/uncharacterized protein YbaR (Trm112 family)